MTAAAPVVVVCGTTASGKSELGVRLARELGGEVVSADSRQVYRGLDLGSGKLLPHERGGIPHHLIDVAEPGTTYTVVDFQRDAYAAIDAITARGRRSLLVGGTGLYVDAVVRGYRFRGGPPDPERRRALDALDDAALLARLAQLDPAAVALVDARNRRRLIRAIELAEGGHSYADSRHASPRHPALELGLRWPLDVLDRRIGARLRARIDAGLVEEVERLLARGVPPEWLDGLGLEYRYTVRHLRGEIAPREEYVEQLARAIRRFARRQLTWFRRHASIQWLDTDADVTTEALARARRFLDGKADER